MRRYPFTPQVLDALPEELAELFRGLELTLLGEIASRLKIAGQLNEVTVQDIRALRALGVDLEDIKQAVSDATNTGMDKLDALLDDVVERNQAYYTDLIDLAQVTAPERLVDERDIAAIRRQTWGAYKNITGSMGFLVAQGGRLTFLEPAKAYEWSLDSAVLQIQSGAISYNQAIAEAVKQLADSGLKTVNYESGHVDSVDVAVRRAVMTGVNQLNQKYREQSMDDLGTDLVEVTAHLGARNIDGPMGWENHAAWQGKVYRWKAKSRTSKGKYPSFEDACGMGSVTGIGGANCRHSYWPFIEGVSECTYTDEQLEAMKPENRPKIQFEGREYDDYQATQKQRQIERTIRKQKRRKAAYEAAGLDDQAQNANIRLRRLNEKYRQFSKAAGLPEQRERMQVLNKLASNLNAPQRKLTQGEEAFQPEKAVDSLLKRLEKSSGMGDNINVLRYYAQNTDFVKDSQIHGPIGYDPKNDVIRFNPNIPLPKGVDRDGILAHELAHRADHLVYDASVSKEWQNAIKQAEEAIRGHETEIAAWFRQGGKYADNAFLADIISALSFNRIRTPYGHPMGYWEYPLNREREIFANLTAIDVLYGMGALSDLKEFDSIIEAFKNIIRLGM